MNKQLRSEKILIVDDSESNRLLLEVMLKKAGFDTDCVSDGVECIEYCEKSIPKVILLDVMMPRMDGFEVCVQMRKTHSEEELPIIMITTKTESEDIAKGITLGANDYITKPIDKSILLARLKRAVRLSESREALIEVTELMERSLIIQKTLGDALPEAIALADESSSVLYCNTALKVICSDRKPSDMQELFRLMYQGRFLEQNLEVLPYEQVRQGEDFEQEFNLTGSNSMIIQIHSMPVVFRSQTLRIWIFKDLTDVRDLEERVNQRIRLDTVGLFASGIAHNFNNILGGILGASELLGRSEEKRVLKCRDIIQRATRSGMELTSRMSVLVNRNDNSYQTKCYDLGLIVANQVQEIKKTFSREVDVNVDILQGVCLAMAEKNIIDIITNIIANAFDAVSDKGSIDITASDISYRFHDDRELPFVELYVKDTGRGISPESLPRVYEPFFSTKNLDIANQLSVEGNGLGLWNVYHLVKMNHGDIFIESELGKGTSVQLTLPVYIEEESTVEEI